MQLLPFLRNSARKNLAPYKFWNNADDHNMVNIITPRFLFTLSIFGLVLFIAFSTTIELNAQTGDLLLDQYPDAYAAYSLRKMSTDYTGPAVRIRRSSDNAEQDFGFIGDDLDTNSINLWLTASDTGFVVRWYSQLDNVPDLVQNNSNLQPYLVLDGEVLKNSITGLPRIGFDVNHAKYLIATLNVNIDETNMSVFVTSLQGPATESRRNTLYGIGPESRNWIQCPTFMSYEDQFYFRDSGFNLVHGRQKMGASTKILNSDGIFWTIFENVKNIDSLAVTTSYSNNRLVIGANNEGGNAWNGYISEILIYPGQLTESDIITKYTLINSYWETGADSYDPTALLPQRYKYQEILYNWMKTIDTTDVTLPSGSLTWDETYTDINQLADLNQQISSLSTSLATRSEKYWYVLDAGNGKGIEATGDVRLPFWRDENGGNYKAWENELAYWYMFHLPKSGGEEGNPYYHNSAIGYRALMLAITDMVMHAENTGIVWSDSYGKAMQSVADVYRATKNLLPDSVQNAFEEQYKDLVHREIMNGPRNANTNMDMFVVHGVAIMYMAANDSQVKSMCVDMVKNHLFGYTDGILETHHRIGPGTFHPAGYIGEESAPDAYYNGESLYHLVGAYAAVLDRETGSVPPDWQFLEEVVRRIGSWHVYRYFNDPNGFDTGPSGFSGRTSDGNVYGQASREWRNYTLASLFPSIGGMASNIESSATLISEINSQIISLNTNFGSVYTGTPRGWSGFSPWPFQGAYLPQSDWYTYLDSLDQNSDSLEFPIDRPGNINKPFGGPPTGDEFWMYKNRDSNGNEFAFYVEADAQQGSYYNGWFGGKIELFWTRPTGTVIINRHGFASHEGSNDWSMVEYYPVHHVWGTAENDGAFSTAWIRGSDLQRTSTFNLNADTATVEVENYFNDESNPDVSNSGEQTGNELTGSVQVTNKFQAISNGIRITTKVTSDHTDNITQLWTTIPINLRDASRQNSLSDATIEYWTGSQWAQLTTSLTNTAALRLGRNFGAGTQYAYISFTSSHELKLSSQVWQDDYQTRTRGRAIHISLLNNPGVIQNIPTETGVTYTIQTTNPVDTEAQNRGSFRTFDEQNWLTLESEEGSFLSSYASIESPPVPQYYVAEFPYGYVEFTVEELTSGDNTTVTLTLPAEASPGSYWKYGPTPDNPENHWYEFLYDGEVGAEINGNVITLHFIDGQLGDDDLEANGVIVDGGGPVLLKKGKREKGKVKSIYCRQK